MVGSLEFILGIAIIIGALWLGWSARASATGPVRRFAMTPWVEEYFVIFIMAAGLGGAVLIMSAAGAA